MCIAAAAGASLGESLIRPGAATRRESFQQQASRVVRALIGAGYWLFMLLLLSGRLFPRSDSQPAVS
jgi:uncharacterized membrane protein SpoIIM required for sporulation